MKPLRQLWTISVSTTPEAEDSVAELLSTVLGTPPSAYTDNESGVCTVTVYLAERRPLPRKIRAQISAGLSWIQGCGLKIGSGTVVLAKLRWENWAESWKRHFKPIEIGDELLIKPSWSKRKPRKGQAVIVLDPGLSFGTGHHPTTAFCLHQIVSAAQDSRNRRPQSAGTTKAFLDLGTGSGILAIAAAKLGFSPVRAVDFDPEAVRVASANARANHVRLKLKIVRGEVSKLLIRPRHWAQGYDLVCANLISDLLIAERRRIAAQLERTGTLVLAGILRSEFGKVQKAYKTLGLRMVSCRDEKEWCSGSFCFGN